MGHTTPCRPNAGFENRKMLFSDTVGFQSLEAIGAGPRFSYSSEHLHERKVVRMVRNLFCVPSLAAMDMISGRLRPNVNASLLFLNSLSLMVSNLSQLLKETTCPNC